MNDKLKYYNQELLKVLSDYIIENPDKNFGECLIKTKIVDTFTYWAGGGGEYYDQWKQKETSHPDEETSEKTYNRVFNLNPVDDSVVVDMFGCEY